MRLFSPLIRFLVLCLLFWGLALAAVSLIPAIEEVAIQLTVQTVASVFGLAGQQMARIGDTLVVGGTSVRIVADCSPHMPWLLFSGVVLAFPAPWRKRLLGLAAGIVAIHLFNVARIVALIGILIRWPRWFEFAHVYLWQTGTILMIVVCFIVWLRWVGPPRPQTAPA